MILTHEPFSSEDLDKIEKEMKKIIKKGAKIERFTKSKRRCDRILQGRKDEPYKVELIEDLPEGEEISFYSAGRLDRSLCRPASDERKRRESIQTYFLLPALTGEEAKRTQC